MGIVYLTVDQIIALHDRALTEDGGMPGLRSAQTLASAVGQPQQSAFGEDAYPTIPEQAAALAYFLVMGHPFNDGNKRTAAAAMDTFLDLNGYELFEDEDTYVEIIVATAAGTVEQDEFFGWVCNHARRTGSADAGIA